MSLELDGRHVVERLVNSSVVEPADVVERRPFDALDVAPGSLAVDQLGLVEAIEALAEGNRTRLSRSRRIKGRPAWTFA